MSRPNAAYSVLASVLVVALSSAALALSGDREGGRGGGGGASLPPLSIPNALMQFEMAPDSGSQITFGSGDVPAIPANLLFNGSPAFTGTVPLIQQPFFTSALGFVRQATLEFDGLSRSTGIPIETNTLNVSTDEHLVIGGAPWHIQVNVDFLTDMPGSIDAAHEHTNGGAFDAQVQIIPEFTFIRQDPPFNIINWNPDVPIFLDSVGSSQWNINGPFGGTTFPPDMYLSQGDELNIAAADDSIVFNLLSTSNAFDKCITLGNGAGSVDLPAGCQMGHAHDTFFRYKHGDGESTLRISLEIGGFSDRTYTPGGNLGGQIAEVDAVAALEFVGTGIFAGFHEFPSVPGTMEFHYGPFIADEKEQVIETEMVAMNFVLPPNFAFDSITISGVPVPGQPACDTVLTEFFNNLYTVDSYFDGRFTISFVGAAGSLIEGVNTTIEKDMRFGQGLIPFQPEFNFGYQISSVGVAGVGRDTDRNLVISNIGSSGDDGARVEVGAVDGVGIDLNPEVFDSEDDFLFDFLFNAAGQGDDESLITVTFNREGDNDSQFNVDYPAFNGPSSGYSLQTFSDGQLIDSFESGNAPPNPILTGNLGTNGLGISAMVLNDNNCPIPNGPGAICNGFLVDIDNNNINTNITVDGIDFSGDRFIFRVENPDPQTPIPAINLVGNTGTNQPKLTISDIRSNVFGNSHRTRRGARIFEFVGINDTDTGLTISNIGSSGNRGIDVDFKGAGDVRSNSLFNECVIEMDVNPDPGLDGEVRIRAVEEQSDVPAVLPQLEIVVTEFGTTSLAVTGEFTPGEQPIEIVEIVAKLNGEIVASYDPEVDGVIGGPLAMVEGDIDVIRKFHFGTFQFQNHMVGSFGPIEGGTFDVSIPGVEAPVTADEVTFRVVRPEAEIPPRGARGGCAQPISLGFSGFEIRASNVESITITDEQTLDPVIMCPGDANGDLVVNVSDLLAVITNWSSTGPAGDVNHDGAVNVTDLLEVINNWGVNCGK